MLKIHDVQSGMHRRLVCVVHCTIRIFIEGQSLDSGAMITSLEADPARHIALRVTRLFWDGPYAAYSTHLETLINLLFYLK